MTWKEFVPIMSKQELLMEYNTQDIIEYIVEDFNVEYDEAMRMFYNSDCFEKLQNEDTGLYLESAAYVYGLFQDESNFGEIVQMEI